MNDINNPEYLNNNDPEKNLDFYRQDNGGMITNHNGLADKLLQNDDLYRNMKGDWKRTDWNKGNNIKSDYRSPRWQVLYYKRTTEH